MAKLDAITKADMKVVTGEGVNWIYIHKDREPLNTAKLKLEGV